MKYSSISFLGLILSLFITVTACNEDNIAPQVDTYSGSYGGSQDESARDIHLTDDGGYVIVGSSSSSDGDITGHHDSETMESNFDIWVTKFDANGNLTWQKSLGGSGNEWASSIQQTNDGGYIVGGSTTSNDGDVTGSYNQDQNYYITDRWIVKLDELGNVIWQKALGGIREDYCDGVVQSLDGGYMAIGWSFSNDGDVVQEEESFAGGELGYFNTYWLTKQDASGELLWQKHVGFAGNFIWVIDIQLSIDNQYLVFGNKENESQKTPFVQKLDESGNLVEEHTLNTMKGVANSIQQTSDGGYVAAGYSYFNGVDWLEIESHRQYWIAKFDASGELLWEKALGGSGDDRAAYIQEVEDGGFVVAGSTYSVDGDVNDNNGSQDCWVLKLNATGDLIWKNALGGSGNDWGSAIKQTADGGFVVSANSESNDGDVMSNQGGVDNWIFKLDSGGNLE